MVLPIEFLGHFGGQVVKKDSRGSQVFVVASVVKVIRGSKHAHQIIDVALKIAIDVEPGVGRRGRGRARLLMLGRQV